MYRQHRHEMVVDAGGGDTPTAGPISNRQPRLPAIIGHMKPGGIGPGEWHVGLAYDKVVRMDQVFRVASNTQISSLAKEANS